MIHPAKSKPLITAARSFPPSFRNNVKKSPDLQSLSYSGILHQYAIRIRISVARMGSKKRLLWSAPSGPIVRQLVVIEIWFDRNVNPKWLRDKEYVPGSSSRKLEVSVDMFRCSWLLHLITDIKLCFMNTLCISHSTTKPTFCDTF